jgi:hypothetical protein
MDAAPKFLTDLLPEEVREYATFILGGGVCLIALLFLLILFSLAKILFGRKPKPVKNLKLEEDLASYPDLKSSSGDRQLRVEGVPVRLRLVVVAPAGTASEVDVDKLPAVFEEIVLGLGEIFKHDKPRLRVWPTQISYQGFGTHFHRNMLTGQKEGEQTRWVLVAGRVKVGKQQLMLGLAMQTIKPNTIGRRTIDSHEWATVLRVRVRD